MPVAEVTPIRAGSHALGWWRRAYRELSPEDYAALVKRRTAEKARDRAEAQRRRDEMPF
jgi:hypothetical protein